MYGMFARDRSPPARPARGQHLRLSIKTPTGEFKRVDGAPYSYISRKRPTHFSLYDTSFVYGVYLTWRGVFGGRSRRLDWRTRGQAQRARAASYRHCRFSAGAPSTAGPALCRTVSTACSFQTPLPIRIRTVHVCRILQRGVPGNVVLGLPLQGA
jgi:hypothetical protein